MMPYVAVVRRSGSEDVIVESVAMVETTSVVTQGGTSSSMRGNECEVVVAGITTAKEDPQGIVCEDVGRERGGAVARMMTGAIDRPTSED